MQAPQQGLFGMIASYVMNSANKLTTEDAVRRLDIQKNSCVVELGPGHGFGLLAISGAHSPSRLIGVEISPKFREELKMKIKASNIKVNTVNDVEVYGDDARDMKAFLSPNSVDNLLAVNVVYFLDPLQSYAEEMYRVMKVGGRGLLACKPAAAMGHDDVFKNKDFDKVVTVFKQAGFDVTREEVKLGNPLADYTAINICKRSN